MSLDDLNKELYNQNPDNFVGRSHEQSEYDPTSNSILKTSPFEEGEQWNQVQKGLTPNGKRALWIAISIFFLIVLAIGGTYFYRWWQKDAFNQDRVAVYFEGPKEADSTQQTKYLIHYKNNNRVSLKNAELQLSYSENFQPNNNLNLKYLSPTSSKIFIGDIAPKREGTVELQGVFYAPKDFPVYLNGTMNFTPSNSTKQLSMEDKIGVIITSSPVYLDVQAPQKVVDGDEVNYVIDYKNLDVKLLSGIQVRVVFPDGFQLASAKPRPSEKDSYWYVGNLDPQESGKITIQGQLGGIDGDGKPILVTIGHASDDGSFAVYSKQELSTQIVSPVLTVKQSLEDKQENIISAGDMLKYVITFKNTGTTGLRDAIIKARIEGKILDFSKINVENGAFDSSTGTITWKASEVPALAVIAPQASGEVRFSIPVKEIIPVMGNEDKNFVIESDAKIDSQDIPSTLDSNKIIGSNKLILKLSSKVLFDTKGYYDDASIKNSGPIPMIAGQETTFAIHWQITNISNDLTNAKVIGSLPAGVRWLGNLYPSGEKVSFNSRTNEVIWNVGTVSAGTIKQPRELVFQVGVTPQINQIGQPLFLTGKSTFTATDSFVNKDVNLDSPRKDTQLYEDPKVGAIYGKVAR